MSRRLSQFLLVLMLWASLLTPSAMAATNSFIWRDRQTRLDADIAGMPVDKFLEKVSASTGWEIYLEPGTRHSVSARFKDLPMDEGFKKLLGKLNFALLPQTNAAPRFYVFRTSMGQATQLIAKAKTAVPERNPDLIPNELIITLKPDAKITIEELAKLLGARIVGRDDALRAYRLRFPDEEAASDARAELASNEDVQAVDSNYWIQEQPPVARLTQNLEAPFPLNPTAVNDPNNLIVAVIDTPIQSLGAERDGFLLPAIAVAGESARTDQPMHGTFMAEALLDAHAYALKGQSSNLKILPIDVYGRSAMTTTYEIGLGVNAAVQNGATYINMSLGTYGQSAFLEALIANVHAQGIRIFASAGNEPVTEPVFPAASPSVIGVTAGKDGQFEPYANRYPGNDMMFPGRSIGRFNGISYVVTGTSSASANAVGLVTATAIKERFTPDQATRKVVTTFPVAK